MREKTLEMAARTRRGTHDIEQNEKVIPFIFRETSFRQNARKLVLGVNVFDVDFGVQSESVKQLF